ncbi:potassium channel family protein [Nesterenkonia sphaerica]|uniref:Two pore domain potassium channel family protein n=1 Tax=Nesterenkonia sphaerica TaxID=1804988 RepID=A0A5R9AJI2_9MICC|nr:potassium channel family protein [Nesterenkonia sphaerica]TLP78949.1 two pore domain potassium channel family protein [Nesterenkonia sphaerica]
MRLWNNRSAYLRWTQLTEWPMVFVALGFLGVYAYVVIGDLRETQVSWPFWVMNAIWVLFAVDYVVSLILVPHTRRWFLTHLHELAIVLLPALRPLRLLRLATALAVLQRSAGAALRGKVILYVAFTSMLLVVMASLAMLDAEQNAPGANITTFSEALWWSTGTITTVGYGDFYPITGLGRSIAVVLMVCGLGLLGTVTATLASWFVERVEETASSAQQDQT